MEIRQLRMFCALVDTGSITGAAGRMYCVQSNVTMRLKELEAELQQQLFIRQRGGIRLTPSGHTFLSYARRILQLIDESRHAVRDRGTPTGPLRLGSMETTAAIRLPRVLKNYREHYPQVQLSLVTGTTIELIKAIENRSLDAAFIGGFHENPALMQEKILDEELVLVSSTQYRSLSSLTRTMPQQTILVFRTGCFYRSTLEQWLHKAGLTPGQILELGTLDGILSCVSAGMGVTLLPRAVVKNQHAQGLLHVHRLPPRHSRISTVFIQHAGAFATSAMRAMLETAKKEFATPADAA